MPAGVGGRRFCDSGFGLYFGAGEAPALPSDLSGALGNLTLGLYGIPAASGGGEFIPLGGSLGWLKYVVLLKFCVYMRTY